LAQSGDVAAAVEKVRGDEGKVLMDQLANTVTQFIDAEEQQLLERNKRINRMRYWLTATSLVALASAAMLALLLFSRVQRY
ncbi:UNVERIFIED_CONTAM: CHASE3 domain-containing protein, partial [Salmonella enterica subsp. enterica serovar Weltevreden]